MMEAVRRSAMPKTRITAVDNEWRKPKHPEFRLRTAWSLFNAFTENNKGMNYSDQIDRSQKLHKMFDEVIEEESILPLNYPDFFLVRFESV